MELLKNYFISALRTAVPLLVGVITGWLATRNVTLNDETVRLLTFVLEGAAGMAYYLVIRALEHLNYRFGWLLGYAKMPTYAVKPTNTTGYGSGN